MTLRRATAKDIETIMEIERQPGFEHLVGRSGRSIHDELVADAGHAYLLGIDAAGDTRGIAILRGIGDPNGGVYLKRIAIRGVGQGFGSTMLAEVIDWAFSLGDCHRFYLDHFVDNARAHRAYEKCGLRQEGVMREAYRLPDGRFADLALMAITRPEWALNRKRAEWKAKEAALPPLQRKLRDKALAVVAETRQQLFAPLTLETTPLSEPGDMFRLWSDIQVLHPASHQVSESGGSTRHGNNSISNLIQSIIPELGGGTKVDLIFSHSIAQPAGDVDWYERFAGALDCDLYRAIEIVDTLERAESRLLWDDVAIAAKDRRWAIWVSPSDIALVSRRA